MNTTAKIILLVLAFFVEYNMILSSEGLPQINVPVSPTQSPAPTLLPTKAPSDEVLGVSVCVALYIDPQDAQAVLPDSKCTPGAILKDVTQENIYQTICKSGYTKDIRPATSYTTRLKRQQIKDYGYVDTNLRDYEEDHLIPLELGGHPIAPQNLWPEPHGSSNEKDKVENYLHKQVCNGTISLEYAQQQISTNWYEVYKSMIPR